MTAKSSLGGFPIDVTAEMHPSIFEPHNLLPGCIANFADNVLIGRTIRSFPGIKHVIYRFVRRILRIDSRQPALSSDGLNVYHVHNDNRVIAFHRWEPGKGQDVVVVASFGESTWWDYAIGMPIGGYWREVFNSDVYDNWPNPWVSGNGGGVRADGPSMHGLPASAGIVIPANGILVFTRE